MADQEVISEAFTASVTMLVEAWAVGDHERFRTLGMQHAARLARSGYGESARRIRDLIDGTRSRATHLPAWSGQYAVCRKCREIPIVVRTVDAKYVKEGSVEFMERQCGFCGHVWYEQCSTVGEQ